MKKVLMVALAILLGNVYDAHSQILISQYVETCSGTTPKSVEIWNSSASDIDMSATPITVDPSNSSAVTINSGILKAGETLVVGTTDTSEPTACSSYTSASFTFNGDDYIDLSLNSVLVDRFGDTTDPGSSWSGGGVSTRNSNIQLKAGITTGDPAGWTDPSIRFETVAGCDMTNFGIPPGGCITPCTLVPILGDVLCEAETDMTDTYSVTISFSGGGADTYTLTQNEGTFTGDDPTSTAMGSFTYTGITEGVDFTLNITSTAGCNIDLNATSPTCNAPIDLIINEILADPGLTDGDANGDGVISSNDDEFVEFNNSGSTPIDLSGWTLSDAVAVRHTFPAGTIVAPGEFITVFGGGTPTGIPGIAQVATDGPLILNNGGDMVTLKDAGGATRLEETFGSEGGNNQSLARDPDFTGAFVQHSTIATNSEPYSPGRLNTIALPVKFKSFEATVKGASTHISWITATEINNELFEVQRSGNGRTFETIAKIAGQGTIYREQSYNYTDEAPLSGDNFYRLKQVDFDGNYEYTDIISVAHKSSRISIYPTSTSDFITIQMDEKQIASVMVYNKVGQTLKSMRITDMETRIDLSSLPSGMYYIQVNAQSGKETKKLIKF